MSDEEKAARIRRAANALAGVASACRLTNSERYLEMLAKQINLLMVAMGDTHRHCVDGDGIETIGETP